MNNNIGVYEIITLCISFVSLIIALLSIYHYSKTKKDNFDLMIYNNTKPIFAFVYDALLIKSKGEYCDTIAIDEAEEQLYSSFEYLANYGASRGLIYLQQFASLKAKADEFEKLLNSMGFFCILSSKIDEYVNYRRKHTSGAITEETKKYLQGFINQFRDYSLIQAESTFKILYKKHPRKKNLIMYYDSLLLKLKESTQKYILQERKKYNTSHKKEWCWFYKEEAINNAKRNRKEQEKNTCQR